MATLIRGMKLEDMVQEVISRFCYLYPKQVDDLKRRMANMRSIQQSESATSDQFGYIGEIPVELNAMMVLNVSEHWRLDPEVRNIFWRLFKIGRMNQRNHRAGDYRA